MTQKTPEQAPTSIATNELFVNRNGTTSLRNVSTGEVMHSAVGPREEATLLYIEQSRLANRLKMTDAPLVLFDAGLGAATNALAALQCHRAEREQAQLTGAAVRDLHMISFENDMSGLRLAYENREHFPFFEGFEKAAAALLEHGRWSGPGINWELREGDFFACVKDQPAPELIFYDFYSPKVNPTFWTVPAFELLHSLCDSRRVQGGASIIYTYSASTRVRVALLLAGFYVGYGAATGFKLETTVAATRLADLDRPLDARWLTRFTRSHDKLPYAWPEEKAAELDRLILAHPQFS